MLSTAIGERVVYKLCFLVHRASHGQSPDYITASRCHFIPVLTAGRQSQRLCRATDEPENGGSSILHCCTASVPTELKRIKSKSVFAED